MNPPRKPKILIPKYLPKKVQIKHSVVVPESIPVPEKFVFFVAPHPDDEVLCCAMKIKETLLAGKSVKIIYLTDGDGKPGTAVEARAYGASRKQESIRAMLALGLNREDLFFLNFPDNHLWDLLMRKTVQSDFTAQTKTHAQAYKKNQIYDRLHLEIILQNIFGNYPPERIYFSDENYDRHSDHRAAGRILLSVIQKLNHNSVQKKAVYNLADDPEILNGIEVLRYVVHSRKKPNLIHLNTEKLNLIRYFASQFHDQAHQQFMETFARKEEKFY